MPSFLSGLRAWCLLLGVLVLASPAAAQQPPSTATSFTVFLDCDRCDQTYLRQQIDFVDYVRDRQDADLHLLITAEAAGAGRAYTLFFIGRRAFDALRDTLHYTSSTTDTDEERRAGLARRIRLGLARYLARTPTADRLTLRLEARPTARRQAVPEEDPWNFWVFRLGLNGSFNAEESTNFFNVEGNASANRVTERAKVRLSLFGSYWENNFDVGDETITSTQRNGEARVLAVQGLGGHWSAGVFGALSTSSFNNTDLSARFAPALEYNVFPYAESTRRELRFSYFLTLRAFDYEEPTVFGKNADALLHHELQVTLEVTQPWGQAQASLEGSQYLYDLDAITTRTDLYRLEFFGFVELRLVRGLSVFAHGGVSRIRDQVFLPEEEATEEDILLGRRRLPTSFEYNVSAGLSYTFGSIYNSAVNARFGS